MQDVSADLQFLAGVRVVDFTQFEAGPSCTEALAWLGAEVVKIENPKTGDPGRRLRPGQPDDDPYYFQMFNANKKSITVNLKAPRGLALVKDLLRKADITVENMAPGTIERLGLGYDEVKKLNPGIIYCQVKGFGDGSPYETNLAFDMIAQATGGTISVTGEKGRQAGEARPVARRHRHRHDDGDHHPRRVAPRDRPARATGCRWRCRTRCCTTCAPTSPPRRAPASAVERDGTRSGGGSNAPSGLYPCAPGGANDYVWIMTSRANPEHWSRLCKVMGREDLIDDPRFATPDVRVKNDAELDAIIADWTRTRTKHEAMAAGRRRRHSGGRGARHDGAAERSELRRTRHHAGDGAQVLQAVKMPAWPVRINGKPPTVKASPVLGEHTADVLTSWLGLSEAEVKSLHGDGIV